MTKRRANGEGSIYRRRDGLWTAQFTAPDGRRRYLYAHTRTEAAALLRSAAASLPPADTRTLGEWLSEWLEVYVRPTVRPRTYAAYHAELYGHIVPALGETPLYLLREEALQRFLARELGRFARSTVSHLRTRLQTSLQKAADLGYIEKNPAARLVLPPADKPERLVFSPEEQRRFELAAMSRFGRQWLAAVPVLLLRTGLRIGEALGLRLEDVDLERKELHVRRTVGRVRAPGTGHAPICEGEPKTRQSRRTVPIDTFTAELLRAAILRRAEMIRRSAERWRASPRWDGTWLERGYLFLTSTGALSDGTDIRRLLRSVEDEAGLPPVTLHGLRHTFATRWVESGLDIKSLSELLGHSDTQMTLNIYTHSLPGQKRACVDRLAELLYGGATASL